MGLFGLIKKGARKQKNNKILVDEKTYHEKNIKGRAIAAVIISILLLTINFFVGYLGKKSESEQTENIIECIYTMINSIIGIILGIGVSTLVLDFFSYIKYTQDRIRDVMIDKEYLNTLSSDEKQKIINSLQSSLYFKNNPIPFDSLYQRIHEKVLPLIDNEHLESYYLHIDCKITENTIEKSFYHKLVIYSDIEKEFYMPFAIYMKKNLDSQVDEKYEVTYMSFNGDDKEYGDVLDKDEVKGDKTEQKKYTIKIPFKLNKGINTIIYKSISTVDIKDNVYVHRLTMPCKKYSAEMSWFNKMYDVNGYGFALSGNQGINVENYENMCKITMEEWSLPGEGCIFTINKK